MGWETRRNGRRYYYKASKVNGRVVKQYLGGGEFAGLLAQMDELDAERARLKAEDERAESAELDKLHRQTVDACDLVDDLARVVLVLAGYRQHDRGEWRKQREQKDERPSAE